MINNLNYRVDKEIFLPITNVECDGIIPDTYYISTKGRLYNILDNQFMEYTGKTYPGVSLKLISGTTKWIHIHRLVITVFDYHPNFKNLEVNHINGKKFDNDINNLEWVTHAENMNHAAITGLITKFRFSDDDVHNIIRLYLDGLYYTEISKIYNCSPTSIYDIITGNTYKYISNQYNIIIRPKRILSRDDHIKMCNLYNDGYAFHEIATILECDRSTVGKILRSISRDPNQEFNTIPLKKYTDNQVNFMCRVFAQNIEEEFSKQYETILKFLHLEDNISNRNGIYNVYNKKTYKNISSLFNY